MDLNIDFIGGFISALLFSYSYRQYKRGPKTSSIWISVADNVYQDGELKTVSDALYFENVTRFERRTHDYVIVDTNAFVTIIPSSRVAWITEKAD